MWIHPDLVEEATWPMEKKGRTCNVISASSKEIDSDVNLLTDSDNEETALLTSIEPLPSGTRFSQAYLMDYDQGKEGAPQTLQEESMDPHVIAKAQPPKELQYAKPLAKEKNQQALSQPFCSDVVAQ